MIFSEMELEPYDIDAAYDKIKERAMMRINKVTIEAQIRFVEGVYGDLIKDLKKIRDM